MAGRALRGAAPLAPGGERRAALGLLLQVLLGWGSAQEPVSCPAPCECSVTARTVKCVNGNLTAVPRDLPPDTRLLFLTGNRLARLPPGAFLSPPLPELGLLNLSGSHLQQVEAGAFASLPSLRQLDLSSNTLARLSPEAFGNASSPLEALNLSHSLSNQSLGPELAQLLGWGALSNLSRLELADNGLLYLPTGMFTSLPSLQHLDLRNNSLVALEAGAFQSLAQLQSLDLSHNSLTCLTNATVAQFRALPRLHRISLGHNTWVCNCCLQHLVSWLKESDQVEGKGALKCSYPDNMRDKLLMKTNSSHLNCSVSVDFQSQLQTSYVFLGIVLALIGAIFLLVLYLNRKGIKKWMYNIRDACRDHMEGYHYRYEINVDPRLTNLSSSSEV
ncbi:trophoblast glycoprotein [Emydura macquarii macquarii]|uniref:trophoblast glycoprotein n=1 Tax=Emydura macquarii macquarii TaxID=1129001 RepID=UPI00352A29C6